MPMPPFDLSAVHLLLHGIEASSLGGPSLRVPKTAEALAKIGLAARVSTYDPARPPAEDLVHLFNLWEPKTALAAMTGLKRAGKTVVFSPIYLDLSAMPYWQGELPQQDLSDLALVAARWRQAAAQMAQGAQPAPLSQPLPGYVPQLCEIMALADHVIFLSDYERQALAALGAKVPEECASLVRNPVEAALWQGGDPQLFRASYLAGLPGPEDYVLSVGRIEPRKNQLVLARAMQDLPLRLVLAGHIGDPLYADRIQREFGERVILTGRLDPQGKMLRSALAGAKAFALVSWAEGASLAALEAAAAGASLVLSNRSSEAEYFGALARYADPGDPLQIRAALAEVLADPDPAPRRRALQALVEAKNSWSAYALATAQAYAAAWADRKAARQRRAMAGPGLDLGDWVSLERKGKTERQTEDRTVAKLGSEIGPERGSDPALEKAKAGDFALGFDPFWRSEAEGWRMGPGRAGISLGLSDPVRNPSGDLYLLLRQRLCFARETGTDCFACETGAEYRVDLAGQTLFQTRVSPHDFPAELLLRLPEGPLPDRVELGLSLTPLPPSAQGKALVAQGVSPAAKADLDPKPKLGAGPFASLAKTAAGPAEKGQLAAGQGLLMQGLALWAPDQPGLSYLLAPQQGWCDGCRPVRIDLCRAEVRALFCPAARFQEGWGVSAKDRLSLWVPLLPDAPEQSLSLRVRVPGGATILCAAWGGREILRQRLEGRGSFDLTCTLPREAICPAAPGRLEIWAEGPGALAEKGYEGLDFGLLSLALEPRQGLPEPLAPRFSPFELFTGAEARGAAGLTYGEGWHLDSQPIWSAEQAAQLYIDPVLYPRPTFGLLSLYIYGADIMRENSLIIKIDGQPDQSFAVPPSGLLEIALVTPKPLPAFDGAKPLLQLTLHLAQITSPAKAGASADPRPLGLQVLGFQPQGTRLPQARAALFRLRQGFWRWRQSHPWLLALTRSLGRLRRSLRKGGGR